MGPRGIIILQHGRNAFVNSLGLPHLTIMVINQDVRGDSLDIHEDISILIPVKKWTDMVDASIVYDLLCYSPS